MSSPSMKPHRFPHRTIYSYRGSTPQLDGVLAPGEWTDAYRFSTADAAQGVRARTTGPNLWTAQFSEVVDATDRGETANLEPVRPDTAAVNVTSNSIEVSDVMSAWPAASAM